MVVLCWIVLAVHPTCTAMCRSCIRVCSSWHGFDSLRRISNDIHGNWREALSTVRSDLMSPDPFPCLLGLSLLGSIDQLQTYQSTASVVLLQHIATLDALLSQVSINVPSHRPRPVAAEFAAAAAHIGRWLSCASQAASGKAAAAACGAVAITATH